MAVICAMQLYVVPLCKYTKKQIVGKISCCYEITKLSNVYDAVSFFT
jgi:hypothetical protein